jgi:hypothetical protein
MLFNEWCAPFYLGAVVDSERHGEEFRHRENLDEDALR